MPPIDFNNLGTYTDHKLLNGGSFTGDGRVLVNKIYTGDNYYNFYNLTTPWDMRTMSENSYRQYRIGNAGVPSVRDYKIHPDGEKFIVGGHPFQRNTYIFNNGLQQVAPISHWYLHPRWKYYEYLVNPTTYIRFFRHDAQIIRTLSTPWDLRTLSSTSTLVKLLPHISRTSTEAAFSPDGYHLYFREVPYDAPRNNKITVMQLNVAFNLIAGFKIVKVYNNVTAFNVSIGTIRTDHGSAFRISGNNKFIYLGTSEYSNSCRQHVLPALN